jgi:hypothetical protein
MTQIADPITLAAENLGRIDPELVDHWRAELQAAPSPERIRQAVYALAGLGSGVEVRIEAIEEVDGAWWAGGTLRYGDHQFVVWPLGPDEPDNLAELRTAMDNGVEPMVLIPPALFLVGPA